MTLSPNAAYGPALPPTYLSPAAMPTNNDLTSIVNSLVGITTMLTQMLGPLLGAPMGAAPNQAYLGQNTLGGGPNGGPSGCSMGGGAACGMHDAVGGGSQIAAPRVEDVPEAPPIPTSATPTPSPVPAPAPAPAPAPPAPPSRGQEAVDKAKEQLGKPYAWGGTGPDGFDCSGLMQSTLKRMGIDIPRTSQEQFKAGSPVEKDQLQPGDLVFFRGDPPGHVGMYIGNDEYIHAPQTGDVVKISKLDQGGSFSGARRYT